MARIEALAQENPELVAAAIERALRQRQDGASDQQAGPSHHQMGPSHRQAGRPSHSVVPSISELSSQSSDEDTNYRRRRGRGVGDGDTSVPQSSLVHSFSTQLREQALSESSDGETTTSEPNVVPDLEAMKRARIEKANRTEAMVPKIPSHLKKTVVTP